MLLMCFNCDYEYEVDDTIDLLNIMCGSKDKKDNQEVCPNCGDNIFYVYHTGSCIKSM